jgi:hypothetical protein
MRMPVVVTVVAIMMMLVIMMRIIMMVFVFGGMIAHAVLMALAMCFEGLRLKGLGLVRLGFEFVMVAAVRPISLEALRLGCRIGAGALDDLAADAIATAAAA